jgi:hypothetical protein
MYVMQYNFILQQTFTVCCHTAVPKWPLIGTTAGAAGSMSSRVQSSVAFLEKVATPKLTFYADNALVLPLWLGMIFKPNNALVRAAMEGYVAIIVVSLGKCIVLIVIVCIN